MRFEHPRVQFERPVEVSEGIVILTHLTVNDATPEQREGIVGRGQQIQVEGVQRCLRIE